MLVPPVNAFRTELGLPEHLEAPTRIDHRASHLCRHPVDLPEAVRRDALQQDRGDDHEPRRGERRDRHEHQRSLVTVEQPDGREHHRTQDRERDQVEERLGDQRAEHDRQALTHVPEPPRHDQRAGGLAEAGWQRGGHQDPDHHPAHGVAPSHARARQCRAQDGVPRLSTREHRRAHQRERHEHPPRRGGEQRVDDRVDPDAVERESGETHTQGPGRDHPDAAGDAGGAAPGGTRELRLDRRQAARRVLRETVGGSQACT